MDYISYTPLNEKVGTVESIIYNPPPELVLKDGIYVEKVDVPQQKDIPNMDAYLRVNLETKELYYDYFLRDTFETKISALQQENAGLKSQIDLMQKALDDVILGGAL